MFKKKLIVASFLVLSLGLTACSDGEVEDPPTETEENQDNEVKDETDNDNVEEDADKDMDEEVDSEDRETVRKGIDEYNEVDLTIEDAYAKFSEEKPNTDLQKLELSYDDEDGYIYKIEGNDGLNHQEMEIDAYTGDLKDVEEKEEDRDEEKIFDSKYIEKLDDLVNKSIDETKDKFKSVEWEVEMDDNVPTLTVAIDTEDGQVDYVYNLETGELIEQEK